MTIPALIIFIVMLSMIVFLSIGIFTSKKKNVRPAGNLVIIDDSYGPYIFLEILDEQEILQSKQVTLNVIRKNNTF